jgi:hypothetical protein
VRLEGKERQMIDKTTTRNRLAAAEAQPARADSLVGSFFHGDVERRWQGCVVAEPIAGVYLVELFGWLVGDSTEQQLVRIEDMAGWAFYDSADWMNNAYEHGGVKERWDRARATPPSAV